MVAECRRRFVALEIGAHPVCPPVSARAAGVVQSVARCQDRNRAQSGHRRLLAPRCRSEANRKSVKAQIRRNGNTPTDRKSVEEGKRVSGRVDLGGSRLIKNKNKQK